MLCTVLRPANADTLDLRGTRVRITVSACVDRARFSSQAQLRFTLMKNNWSLSVVSGTRRPKSCKWKNALLVYYQLVSSRSGCSTRSNSLLNVGRCCTNFHRLNYPEARSTIILWAKKKLTRIPFFVESPQRLVCVCFCWIVGGQTKRNRCTTTAPWWMGQFSTQASCEGRPSASR